MRKFKFAVQVFILAASFPVLFIAGINSGKAGAGKETTQQVDSSFAKKSFQNAEKNLSNM